MTEILDRYRRRADVFQAEIAAVRPEQWMNQSPCEDWTARDVVRHVVGMHEAMLRPLGRTLGPGPSVDDDTLGAFVAARHDIEAVLSTPELAGLEHDSPAGRLTVADEIDQVVSQDFIIHGWDLARATGQDDTIDADEVERMWPLVQNYPPQMWIPNAFGPGMKVLGPKVEIAVDAPLQDRLLGWMGRDPRWAPLDADTIRVVLGPA